MDVLPDNTRMLAMIDRRWPDAPRSHGRDSVTIRVPAGHCAAEAA
jgi:hypothetical protein